MKSKNSPKLFIGKIQIFFIKIFNKEYIDLFSSKNKKNDLFKEKYIQKTEQINNPNFLKQVYCLFFHGIRWGKARFESGSGLRIGETVGDLQIE